MTNWGEHEVRIRDLLTRDVRQAATAALEALAPSVLGYMRSILREEDDVKDAFSMFAEELFRGLPAFRGDASLRTWAFRLAWHSSLRIRKDTWRRRGQRLATSAASHLADGLRTRSSVRFEHQRLELAQLVQELPMQDQSLFALRIGEELSWEEIAGVLSERGERLEVNTLTKRFVRLKERLTRMAKDRGLLD